MSDTNPIDVFDCSSCAEGMPKQECPKSERPCGHHCNHSWTQDICDWCGREFGDEEDSKVNWALVATGEGAECLIVDGGFLKQGLHNLMCICPNVFWKCETPYIHPAIVEIDKEDNWINDESGKRYTARVFEYETGRVDVYRISGRKI